MRVMVGQRYIYGSLPEEISEMRNPVKVWLAEDYAPPNCQAFFFVFSSTVVVHGVREQSDEGHLSWRTAQLVLPEGDPLVSIVNAISDYALANSAETLTVAVLNQLDLYEKLQTGLATYGISPVPFSKLKPLLTLRPLYRHHDYTILYLTLVLFGCMTMLASAGYLMLTFSKRSGLDSQIAEVEERIRSIKRNQSIGDVQDPQAVLESMGKPMRQQPSAVLDAAASAAAEFGNLSSVRFEPQANDMSTVSVMDFPVHMDKLKDTLLLDQESRAKQVLAERQWVRDIKRTGVVGEQADLIITLQIDQAPSGTAIIPPSPTVPQAMPAGQVSDTSISATMVSGTLVPATPGVSVTLPVSPVAMPMGVSAVSSIPAMVASPTQSVSGVAVPVPPVPVSSTQGEGGRS
jgi:hypothetical protein